jgi:DNA-binding transcriptional ArsR family regulator
MSYGRERTDPAGGWEELVEWTGGLPPEEIRALAAVRPLEAVHSLLRGLTGRTPRELLARAAVLEALASQQPPHGAGLDEALAWLAEPARGETLSALSLGGWLEPGAAGSFVLTGLGRQVWDALRRAGSSRPAPVPPLLPPGITPEEIVRALLTWSVEELAEAGRDALVPILPALPLLNIEAVARAAETQARSGDLGTTGDRPGTGTPRDRGDRRDRRDRGDRGNRGDRGDRGGHRQR